MSGTMLALTIQRKRREGPDLDTAGISKHLAHLHLPFLGKLRHRILGGTCFPRVSSGPQRIRIQEMKLNPAELLKLRISAESGLHT